MRKWKHVLAMCLTGAMLMTGLPVQSFAMDELSAGPEEESSFAVGAQEELLFDEEVEEVANTEMSETLSQETSDGEEAASENAGLLQQDISQEEAEDVLLMNEEEIGESGDSEEFGTSEEPELFLSDGEDASLLISDEALESEAEDELTAGEDELALVMDGTDTTSGTTEYGTLWTFSKSTGLLVLTCGETVDYLTRYDIPGDIFEEIQYVRIVGFAEIHDDAFLTVPNLRGVYMDDSVIRIGSGAFQDCDRLESVRLSENLESIELSAFNGCAKLERITIPFKVEKMGNHVFTDCTSLTEITILSSDCEISDNAIGCMVNENDGVFNTNLTVRCYYGSTAEEYAKNKGLKLSLIEGDRFSGECGEALQWEVSVEDKRLSIEGIGDMYEYVTASPSWVYLYENIQEISIGAGVTSICEQAFYNQINATKVSIPNSVTTIGAQAFIGCSSLKEITLTNKNVVIGQYALGFTPNYTTSTPDKISGFVIKGYRGSTAEAYATANGITFVALNDQDVIEGECGAYLTWRYTKATGLLEIMGSGFMLDYSNAADNLPPWTEIVGAENIKSISIGDHVNSIGAYAFCGMTKVKTMDLPQDLWEIGEHGLEGCTSLTTVLFDDSLEKIGAYAFAGCTSLTNVSLPEDLCQIGDYAFENCVSIKKLVIPMGVGYYNSTLGHLGIYAFSGCSGLTDLTIKNAQDIPQGCFRNCSSLKNITLSETVSFIGQRAFEGCSSLTQVTLPIYIYSVDAYAFYNCPSLKVVTDNGRREPKDRQNMQMFYSGYSIGDMAFGYLSSADTAGGKVSDLTIRGYERSASIAYAKKNGFNYEIIPYPTSGSCGAHATWNYNTNTKTLTIQGTGATKDWESEFITEAEYTYIPNDWFGWIFDAKKIVVEEGITSLGIDTCMMMENVTEVELPDSLTEIKEGSFYGLISLEKIWFPQNIQSISNEAFYYFYGPLKTVYGYAGTESQSFASRIEATFIDRTRMEALEQETVRVTKTQMGPGYISITWNSSENASLYRIYRRVDSGATTLVKTVSSSVLTYKDTDVTVGKTYRYMVAGVYDVSKSQVETKTLKYIQVPSVTATPTKTGMQISWEASANVTGYRLYCKDETSRKITRLTVANVSTTSFNQTGLTSGNAYTYTIQAYKGGDVIVYESATVLYLQEPVITIANSMNGVSLKWNKVTGASGYNIYRKTASTSYKKLTNVGADVKAYTDTTAVSGTTYTYSVVAYKGSAKSSYPTKNILCVKGTTVSLANTVQGVQVKWTKVPGVSGYNIYRKTASGKYGKLATVGSSVVSYTDTTASSGVSYYYAVRPYSGSVQGVYEQKAIRRLDAPGATATRTARGVALKWTKVTGATGYYIYRKTGTGSYQKIAEVTSSTVVAYLDRGASSSKSYTYAVRAYNGTTQSGYKEVTVK